MFYKTNLKFNEELDYLDEYVSDIIIHHSEVTSPHTVEDIHRWHQNKGWAGVGYHYFISKAGDVYQGRPLYAVGAHAKGHNRDSIGVCFEGDFNKETISDEQFDASVMLLTLLSLAYDSADIVPHSSLSKDKTCPGCKFPMDRLLEAVSRCKAYFIALYGEPLVKIDATSESVAHYTYGDYPLKIEDGMIVFGDFDYRRLLELL